MEIIMRRAKVADAEAINDICNQLVGREGQLEIDERPVEYRRQWLLSRDKRHPVFVGSAEGRVICWAALGYGPGGYPFDCVAAVEIGLPVQMDSSELTDLLLRFLEQQATRLGYYKLMACLEAQQRYLLHTYRRVGFRDVGTLRSHGYCKGKLVDLVMMERLLPADMNFLEEYYSKRYDFYQEYFEAQRRHSSPDSQGNYALEYEEVEVPEGQLPEGIVRFLRTKKTPDGKPIRKPVESPDPLEQAPESPAEPVGDLSPAAQAPGPGEPRLPEGIIRFLKSKKRPDGTPLDPELPPVVPVKLPAASAGQGTPGGEEPDAPEEEAEDVPLDDDGELEGQLQFDDILS